MTTQGGKPSSLEKYGMLLMGVFLIILAGGRFVTPAAAFLAPVFLLMFTRNTGLKQGAMVLYALLFLSLLVRLHGYVPVPRPVFLMMVAGFALIELLPFLIDRKLFQKLPTAVVPLVLPVGVVSLGYLIPAALPFGVISGAAYTQVGNLELMQLSASTGIHGITFLIFWFASTMASLWDSGFVWRRCRKQFLPMSVVLMIVFISGGYRVIFDDNEAETIRVAGIVATQTKLQQSLKASGYAGAADTLTLSDSLRTNLDVYHDELFSLTEKEAQAGARIIVWAEGGGIVLESGSEEFLQRAKTLAEQNNIYLAAAVTVLSVTAEPVHRYLVFDPQGQRIIDRKSTVSYKGLLGSTSAEPLAVTKTGFGDIVFAHGLDLHSVRSIRRSGSTGVDLIIAPAMDWKTSAPHLSYMAAFRGVENGASVFRVPASGLLIASDTHGRILAQSDQSEVHSRTIVASIKVSGVSTFYAKAGDWFAWLCLLLAAALVYLGFFKPRAAR